MRVCAEQNHTWDYVVFEKMLVGYASLDKPDTLLLGELSNQNMEIGYFLVGSRISVIND